MRAQLLEVLWHDKSPVHAADIDATGRLATAGSDSNVRLWRLAGPAPDTPPAPDAPPQLDFLATLNRHQAPVNAVRFSPDGQRLASAGDDGLVLLWRLISTEPRRAALGEDDEGRETWGVAQTLRGGAAGSDIYDVAWSPEGAFVAAASIDHTLRVFDVAKGTCVHTLNDHAHYVQGVAWDPRGRLLASQSSDRSCRVYRTEWAGKALGVTLHAKLHRAALPAPSDAAAPAAADDALLFQDESLASFFRRLAFSPDGSLLVVPAGQTRAGQHTVYVFALTQLSRPLYHLPGHRKPAVAVRFSPVLYALRTTPQAGETATLLSLPYRMLFAVATQDTVLLYDTQQPEPLALVANMHYSSITDVAWAPDGTWLIVASRDGYCSLVRFDPGELGHPYNGTDAALAALRPFGTTAPAKRPLADGDGEAAAPAAPAAPAAAPAPPAAKRRIQLVPVVKAEGGT